MTQNILKKTAIATSVGTLFTSILVGSAFADTKFEISGNGSRSDNQISSESNHSVDISQSNDTDINNDVNISNNTGNVSANDNTGGDVSVRTGEANTEVRINNMAGWNQLSLADCTTCDNTDMQVKIHGNGSNSDNEIDIESSHEKSFKQENNSDFDNDVNVENHTGNVSADDNTSGSYGNGHNNYGNDNYMHGNMDMSSHNWMEKNGWNMSSNNSDFWKDFHKRMEKVHSNNRSNSGNMSGEVSIMTGDADSNVEIHNMGSANMFEM